MAFGFDDDVSSMWGPTANLADERQKGLLALLQAGLVKGGLDPNAPMTGAPAQKPPDAFGPQDWSDAPQTPAPVPDAFDANATDQKPTGWGQGAPTAPTKPTSFFDRFGDPMTRIRMGAALLSAAQERPVGAPGGGWGNAITGAADAYEGGQRTMAQKKALLAMQAASDPQKGLNDAIMALGKSDPTTALSMAAKRVPQPLTMKEQIELNKPVFGKEGEVGYTPDLRTGKYTATSTVPTFIKPPAGFRIGADGKSWDIDPNWLRAQIELKKAGRPETSITVNNPGEGAFEKGIGEQASKVRTQIGTDADLGRTQLQQVEQLGDALTGVDYQGFGANSYINLKRAAKVIGLDLGKDDIGSAQVAKAVQSQLALSLRKDLPGNLSNADREFLTAIPPNINNSKEANAALLEIMRAKAQRSVDLEASYNQANIKTLADFQRWESQVKPAIVNKPLFSDALKAQLLSDLGGQ
jgi:hypothetical protein